MATPLPRWLPISWAPHRSLGRSRLANSNHWRVPPKNNGVGWGTNLRAGNLNAGPLENRPLYNGSFGNSSVSNGVTTDYFSFDVFNARQFTQYGLSVHTSIGWEIISPREGRKMMD